MDIIIPLLIVLVLIGIPTWLMVRTMNKDDKNTIVYSPEEVTKKLRNSQQMSRPTYYLVGNQLFK